MGDDILQQADVRADIVKIDVEGFEKPVLLGLQAVLHRDRPLVVVECTPTTRDSIASEAEFRALFPPDYAFYYFAKGSNKNGRYRLAPYRYGMKTKIEDIIACPSEQEQNLLHPVK